MGENSNSVESMIDNLVTVVFRIHFYYVSNKDLEQDLKQEGYMKAYELLSMGNYDPTKNLRTFIYTGIRNAMTNYMYHTKKEQHENIEDISSPMWQRYESVTSDDYYRGKIFCTNDDLIEKSAFNLELVFDICDKYKDFGDYTGTVLDVLNQMGLCGKTEYKSELEPNNLILTAILGEIFWTMFKK